MKLEVGMYVRLQRGIYKIMGVYEGIQSKYCEYLNGKMYYTDGSGYRYPLEEENVTKANYNLKKVLEVRDIIKYRIDNVPLETKGYLTGVMEIEDKQALKNILKNKDFHILSVLTHRQFEKDSYKVVE